MKIHRKWLRWLAGGLAAGVLVAGVWLIVDYVRSLPPDPSNDDSTEVVAFFFSDYFDRLSPGEQRRYIQEMVQRYGSMDSEQREAVEAAVHERQEDDPESMRERMIEMWKGYVVTEAEQYVQVPPEQRPRWLEQRIAGWQMMFGGGGSEGNGGGGNGDRGGGGGDRDGGDRDRGWDQPLTRERQAQAINFMQEQIMPRTSARERALVSLFARDVQQQMQD